MVLKKEMKSLRELSPMLRKYQKIDDASASSWQEGVLNIME